MSLIKALNITFQAQTTIVSNANGPGPDVVCYLVYVRQRILFSVLKTIKNS